MTPQAKLKASSQTVRSLREYIATVERLGAFVAIIPGSDDDSSPSPTLYGLVPTNTPDLWENLSDAMIYDVKIDQFRTRNPRILNSYQAIDRHRRTAFSAGGIVTCSTGR